MTGGFGADYTIEATGLVAVMRQAVESARMGWGLATMCGVAGKGETLDVIPRYLITGRRVAGSSFGGVKGRDQVPLLVQRYLDGDIDVDAFLSHRITLDEVNRGFELMEAQDGIRSVIGVQLTRTSMRPSCSRTVEDGLRVDRRPLLDAAVVEAEAALMPRAFDAAVDELALVQRPAAVVAAVGERVQRAVGAHDHDLDVADGRRHRPVVAEHARVEHRRPVLRPAGERRLVDADAARVRQVAAEPAGRAHGAGAGEAEQHARRVRAAAAGEQRGAVEQDRAAVGGGVHDADPADLLVADLAVGPVRPAGPRRRAGREQADADEPLRGRAAGLAADEVEDRRARPGPDRDVREQRVQRVAEPRAAERVLDGSGGQELADLAPDGLGGGVEHAERGDLLAERVGTWAVGDRHGGAPTRWQAVATAKSLSLLGGRKSSWSADGLPGAGRRLHR